MSEFTERMRNKAYNYDNTIELTDAINQSADIIDAMERVLKLFQCIDFERFTEHDEMLLDSVITDTRDALAKLECLK